MEEKISVCLMNDSFPPLIDGVENTVTNYAHIITEKYGKATVAVPYYPGADDSGYPFKVVRYPSLNTEKLVNYRAGYPFSADALEEIKPENVNIIHTHCPFASTVLARTLRGALDAPVVFTYHTKFDIDIARAVKNKFIRERVIKELVKNIEACDDVWVVSEGAGENLRSLGFKGDYIVMPNGVDIPKGRVPEELVAEITGGYDLPKDVPVFLFVGRMAWYKGLDIIIEALSGINEKGRDFRMVFIGGGLDKDEVEKFAEEKGIGEKCIFTGSIHDRDAIRAWYCRADLFLFPSVYDTNGLVVREAAACSLGSMLVEGSCASEGITDCDTGFLCENTPEAFEKKLLEIMEIPGLVKKVGENAAEKIYVSWEDSVARAVERYKYVIETHKTGVYAEDDTLGDEWLKNCGEILDDINSAKRKGKKARNEVIGYGKNIISASKIAAESFKKRGINIKNVTVEKGKRIKTAIKKKVDRYI